MNIKIIKITNEDIELADNLYDFNNLNGSITQCKSKIYGAIGEIMTIKYFRNNNYIVKKPDHISYDYDLIINDYKIDVKTKKTTVFPQKNYLCSISAFNTTQKCDFYFFARVSEDLKNCYLLGYKNKNQFYKEATFNKKGDIDINGFIFKDDCYNLPIKNLNHFIL